MLLHYFRFGNLRCRLCCLALKLARLNYWGKVWVVCSYIMGMSGFDFQANFYNILHGISGASESRIWYLFPHFDIQGHFQQETWRGLLAGAQGSGTSNHRQKCYPALLQAEPKPLRFLKPELNPYPSLNPRNIQKTTKQLRYVTQLIRCASLPQCDSLFSILPG